MRAPCAGNQRCGVFWRDRGESGGNRPRRPHRPPTNDARRGFCGHRETRRRTLSVVLLKPLVLFCRNDLKGWRGLMLPRHIALDRLFRRTIQADGSLRKGGKTIFGNGSMATMAQTHSVMIRYAEGQYKRKIEGSFRNLYSKETHFDAKSKHDYRGLTIWPVPISLRTKQNFSWLTVH